MDELWLAQQRNVFRDGSSLPYWTSTASALNNNRAWYANHNSNGATSILRKSDKVFVRCVQVSQQEELALSRSDYATILNASEDTAGCGFLSFGCEDPLQLPSYDPGFYLKHYRRVKVFANRYPWIGSEIILEQGDQILVMASGKVTICRHCGLNTIDQPPNSHLRMRVGDGMNFIHYSGYKADSGYHFSYDTANNSGELQFAVEDWRQYPPRQEVYTDNSGSYLLDVFVFDNAQEEGFKELLRAMIRQNPKDTVFVAQAQGFLR